MLRYKSKKQTVIIAAFIILLCFVCLTGSTLALFTSDPEKGTIGVITTSGRVDVGIVDTASKPESLEGKVLQFITTSTQQNVEFEPGAMFYTQGFRIINNGNIPIKFHLYVSDDEKEDMKAFHEAFEIWITTDPFNTSPAVKLDEFYGELKKNGDTSDIYYLVVKMKANAGNKFQGRSFSGIGVTVFAVQGNTDITDFKE